jgi:hypothetical protein
MMGRREVNRTIGLGCVAAVMAWSGCGGDAQVELSAAETMDALAGQMEVAMGEYHGEVMAGDDGREQAVADAFVARVMRDREQEEAVLEGHAEAFRSALAGIRADRGVELKRYEAAMENVDALREVADGLRRVGVESLGLQDELRRYVSSLLERRASSEASGTASGRSK